MRQKILLSMAALLAATFLVPSVSSAAQKKTLNVLFVGNSFHRMPQPGEARQVDGRSGRPEP